MFPINFPPSVTQQRDFIVTPFPANLQNKCDFQIIKIVSVVSLKVVYQSLRCSRAQRKMVNLALEKKFAPFYFCDLNIWSEIDFSQHLLIGYSK